jgi:exodeoxyribonuclease-3
MVVDKVFQMRYTIIGFTTIGLTVLVMTCNVNGIRSAKQKGLFDYIQSISPDVICLQEIKADASLFEETLYLDGYQSFVSSATKKGYSGVAIYTKQAPLAYTRTFDLLWAEAEGRFISIELPTCHVASIYFPSGTSGEHRQALKIDFLSHMSHWLEAKVFEGKPYILCGDWNIAHRAIDLKNWKQNQTHSGFLPEERAWMDHVETVLGLVDTFRLLHPQDQSYTWWTYRGDARARDVGWRIDYQWLTPSFPMSVKEAWVEKDVVCSDHAPYLVRYGAL